MKRLAFCLSVLMVTSCICKNEEIGRYLLTDNDRAFVPHTVDDISEFVTSGGFQFQLRTTAKEESLEQTPTIECENYDTYGLLETELTSTAPDLFISIRVFASEFGRSSEIEVNGSIFALNNLEAEPASRSINGVTYSEVYQINNPFSDNSVIAPSQLLYNTEVGLIQIKFTNEDTFTLVN